jgi:hypothetical protein
MKSKEVIVIAQSIPKRTVTKDYPKSKSPNWIRTYSRDRQEQENHQ